MIDFFIIFINFYDVLFISKKVVKIVNLIADYLINFRKFLKYILSLLSFDKPLEKNLILLINSL